MELFTDANHEVKGAFIKDNSASHALLAYLIDAFEVIELMNDINKG